MCCDCVLNFRLLVLGNKSLFKEKEILLSKRLETRSVSDFEVFQSVKYFHILYWQKVSDFSLQIKGTNLTCVTRGNALRTTTVLSGESYFVIYTAFVIGSVILSK